MIKEDEYKKVVARNLRNIMWQQQKPRRAPKIDVLRGVIMPAAGVEPAQNISIIMYFAVRANFRAKTNKKRAEHKSRPPMKKVCMQ